MKPSRPHSRSRTFKEYLFSSWTLHNSRLLQLICGYPCKDEVSCFQCLRPLRACPDVNCDNRMSDEEKKLLSSDRGPDSETIPPFSHFHFFQEVANSPVPVSAGNQPPVCQIFIRYRHIRPGILRISIASGVIVTFNERFVDLGRTVINRIAERFLHSPAWPVELNMRTASA